ncbi:hypothetical protein C8R43DRAFT_311410 [Mycena crocata]|nr:hypothetical protein C8R43DRAFT_311410 [Mycena crocata]
MSATVAADMRVVGTARVGGKKLGMHSLVISPDLDALLEHEDRTRRLQHIPGGSVSWSTTSGSESPGFVSSPVSQGLPPPPRRSRTPRAPGSPLSPPPRSPFVGFEPRAGTPTSSVGSSNPYINPAPQFDVDEDVRTPISPPPRTSSIGVEAYGIRGRGTMAGRRHDDDRSPGSSQSGSTSDSRAQTARSLLPSPRVDRFLKWSPPKDHPLPSPSGSLTLTPRRSRGKLVKQPRERERERESPSTSSSQPQSPRVPDMSTNNTNTNRRRRKSSPISVSSARRSSDRESFIDLFSPGPANQEFPREVNVLAGDHLVLAATGDHRTTSDFRDRSAGGNDFPDRSTTNDFPDRSTSTNVNDWSTGSRNAATPSPFVAADRSSFVSPSVSPASPLLSSCLTPLIAHL